ncbi:MAG: hypothetical protein NTZ79_08915 [Proteobacteria bacterium]|nr:hypothetical protein [Pseudomonadota bacterium]
MNAPLTAATVRRNRIQLVLLALMFFGPVGLSFWMYYGAHFQTRHLVNHGELLTPARPLPEVALATPAGVSTPAHFLRGKWSIVYVTGEKCDSSCLQDLVELRAVHQAMDRERDRVQRVLLGEPPCCTVTELGPEQSGLVVAWLDSRGGRQLLAPFPQQTAAQRAGRTYIVDPLGNLVMSFAVGADRKGLIKDLDKLLRLSHIG